ncbi:MAG: KOW domain-containing RNA-binding protein [Oscillospiraceae bacterium]|jgi:ribosomal protein L14E/L6E/L27E|nr:KOW domain-containing RNA-binding protein [Oscillospiraceae bacterium]
METDSTDRRSNSSEIAVADIVTSLRGRDVGREFFVVAADDSFVYLADGRLRRIERPKKKKRKHVTSSGNSEARAAEKLRGGERVTNAELRRALAERQSDAETQAPPNDRPVETPREAKGKKTTAKAMAKEGGMHIGKG